MKFNLIIITTFSLLISTSTFAQEKDLANSKVSLKDFKEIIQITLDSDSSTKSVLVSNVLENKSGDMSPVIGAAIWNDNGKEFKCNSLIKFDFNLIPAEILDNPWLILQAYLILYPINVQFASEDNEKASVLNVRQVLGSWEDSSTKWNHQPEANITNQITTSIDIKDKNKPVKIDVTEFVLNNIMKDTNNGFQIVYDENINKSYAAGQLFASPKNENPETRPQLVVYAGFPKGDIAISDRFQNRKIEILSLNNLFLNNISPKSNEYIFLNNNQKYYGDKRHFDIINTAPQSQNPRK